MGIVYLVVYPLNDAFLKDECHPALVEGGLAALSFIRRFRQIANNRKLLLVTAFDNPDSYRGQADSILGG